MSKHVYKILELTGSSPSGIEDAVNSAIAKASETVRNMHWFEVVETRGHVVDGRISHYQVTLKVGFRLAPEEEGGANAGSDIGIVAGRA